MNLSNNQFGMIGGLVDKQNHDQLQTICTQMKEVVALTQHLVDDVRHFVLPQSPSMGNN